MISGKRIGVAGCKHTTLELLEGLARNNIKVDAIITIPPDKGAEQKVAGYFDLGDYAKEKSIPLYSSPRYDLKKEECEKNIKALKLDLVFVMGWQRLLPDWFLDDLSIGAFGMHGSNRPLPHGRGRSPMNWSLIQGKNIFFTHLFKYSTGVDDGPIVAVQKFQINKHDTCLTLHYKNTLSMIRLCVENIDQLVSGTVKYIDQGNEAASYYPKRSAEDGILFWEDSTQDIYNLVRAVTKPFPGAFSFLGNDTKNKLTIWRAIPFDQILDWKNSKYGEVLEVFDNGDFLVKTGDGSLLIQEYEGLKITKQHIGHVFGTAGQKRKQWPDLPT